MKTIIAGSRGITDYYVVLAAILESNFEITEVVSGTARGVDSLGETYAVRNKLPIAKFPADWDRFGKRAGFLRNADMALYADALIAVWDGKSKGTKHMIDCAKLQGLKTYIHYVKD